MRYRANTVTLKKNAVTFDEKTVTKDVTVKVTANYTGFWRLLLEFLGHNKVYNLLILFDL